MFTIDWSGLNAIIEKQKKLNEELLERLTKIEARLAKLEKAKKSSKKKEEKEN